MSIVAPTVKQMLDICRSYIGTAEGPNNWNIFAKELDKVDYFKPQKKQNKPYCSIFLDDMAYKLIKDVEACHKWLYQPLNNDLSASATYQMNYFKKVHRFFSIPQPGDWAFVKKTGVIAKHVCIVESVGPTTVTTIDANHGKKVCRVVRARSLFLGFGRPVYNKEGDTTMVEMKNIKKGDNCGEVLTTQSLLKCKGFKGKDGKVLALDSKFGVNTDYAAANFCKKYNIPYNGVIDGIIWNKLLKG